MSGAGPLAFRCKPEAPSGVHSIALVRRVNHRLLLMLGRNAASTPIIKPTRMNVTSAAIQLLSRHHGRNDQVAETSEAAGQVDAQTQSPNTIVDATNPAIRPTTAPFLMFGYMMHSIRLTPELRHRHRSLTLAAMMMSKFHGLVKTEGA